MNLFNRMMAGAVVRKPNSPAVANYVDAAKAIKTQTGAMPAHPKLADDLRRATERMVFSLGVAHPEFRPMVLAKSVGAERDQREGPARQEEESKRQAELRSASEQAAQRRAQVAAEGKRVEREGVRIPPATEGVLPGFMSPKQKVTAAKPKSHQQIAGETFERIADIAERSGRAFDPKEAARHVHSVLVAEHDWKGQPQTVGRWASIFHKVREAKKADAAAKRKAADHPLNFRRRYSADEQAMRSHLAEDPSDPHRLLVFADWLQERGHEREADEHRATARRFAEQRKRT